MASRYGFLLRGGDHQGQLCYGDGDWVDRCYWEYGIKGGLDGDMVGAVAGRVARSIGEGRLDENTLLLTFFLPLATKQQF